MTFYEMFTIDIDMCVSGAVVGSYTVEHYISLMQEAICGFSASFCGASHDMTEKGRRIIFVELKNRYNVFDKMVEKERKEAVRAWLAEKVGKQTNFERISASKEAYARFASMLEQYYAVEDFERLESNFMELCSEVYTGDELEYCKRIFDACKVRIKSPEVLEQIVQTNISRHADIVDFPEDYILPTSYDHIKPNLRKDLYF